MADLTFEQFITPATQGQWLATLFDGAIALGLPTTSWRTGDPERVFLTLLSFLSQQFDALASAYNQGGFIDFAATGTVTIEVPDGGSVTFPVSPDPSDPTVNPTGARTLLDELCSQNYAVDRILFTFAGGAEAIVNTSVTTYGPFAAGSYHIAHPTTKATYSNTASLSIPPSTLVGTAITGAANASGLIKITTSGAHGLSIGDPVFITGVLGTTEANGAWYVFAVPTATTFTLAGSLFTNAWTSGGLAYEPTVATFTADVGGSASSSTDTNGDLAVNVITTSVTSLFGVSVSNLVVFVGTDTENNIAYAARTKLRLAALTTNGARGAYEFYALTATTYAPLLVPALVVSTAITRVVVSEAFGHAYVWIANGAGAPSIDDVDAVDAVLQRYAKPIGITLNTGGATEVTVQLVATVWLRAQFATEANKAILIAAIQTYFRLLPIGGFSDPGLAYTNKLVFSDVLGVIYETARANLWTLDKVTLALNSGTTDISLPVNTSEADVAILSPATPDITFNPT